MQAGSSARASEVGERRDFAWASWGRIVNQKDANRAVGSYALHCTVRRLRLDSSRRRTPACLPKALQAFADGSKLGVGFFRCS